MRSDPVRLTLPNLPQALVQYPDPTSASNAKQALEGHAIYDGGYNRVSPPAAPSSALLKCGESTLPACLPCQAFHSAEHDFVAPVLCNQLT
jgi:hypothetical protein